MWVDNNVDGAFEESLDVFFPHEEVLAALYAANDSKVGRPFRVPDIVIRWGMEQVVARGMNYRAVAKRISKRMNDLDLGGSPLIPCCFNPHVTIQSYGNLY